MKTKLLLSVLLSFVFDLLSSQVPQGFNYQAIARGADGKELANTPLQVQISILSDTSGFYKFGTGTYIWEEQQSVTTNSLGLFTLVFGNPAAVKIQGSASKFSTIDWTAMPLYIGTKIYYQSSWKILGSAQLWTVPYSMVSANLKGTLTKLGVKGTTTSPDSILFEVKNQSGQTIFAVYNEGVRIYVDDGSKGTKGGFAVGGFGTPKAQSQEYLRVTRDSTRVYVNQAAKALKGGFAVGGFGTKADPENFLKLTKENYFIGQRSGAKNISGIYNSFIGYESGLNNRSGRRNVFLGYHSGYSNDTASYNVFIGNDAGYTNRYGRFNTFMGFESGYTTDNADYNTFVGYQAGRATTYGDGNLFIGYTAGLSNTSGFRNVFLGYNSGKYNISGYENTFVGGHSGYGFNSGNANIMVGTYAGNYFYGGNNNIFIGNSSGHSQKFSTNMASNNVFIGVESGKGITTGGDNAFIGTQAGFSNSTGINNVFIGNQSGYNNTGGYNNIFIGYFAGKNANATTNSTFIGNEAGKNIIGDDNIAIGDQAGVNNYVTNPEMFGITILGIDAGRNLTGNYNTILGYGAGSKWSGAGTGTNNTYVGSQAGSGPLNDNNVCIGYKAGSGASGSNKLFIANNEISPLIYGEFDNRKLRFNGNVGINTDDGSIKLYSFDDAVSGDNPAVLGIHNITPYYGIGVKGVGGWIGVKGESTLAGSFASYGVWGSASGGTTNYGVYGDAYGGTAWAGYFNGNVSATGYITAPSDRNLKKNILPMSGSLKKILGLQGVTYEWKSESELSSASLRKSVGIKEADKQSFNFPKGTQLGVIAQDVEKILPELVHTDADGLKSVDYIKMIPLLIEAIKEQQKEIEDLKAQVKSLVGGKR